VRAVRVLPAEGPGAAGERLEVEYDDGTRTVVPRAPGRIVSALPGITEMLVHLGALDRLVAVSSFCDHPAELRARDLPRVQVQPFGAEGVLAVRPDLLVVDRRLVRRDLQTIRRRVPAVLLLESSRSLRDLAASFDLLAQVLGTPEARERSSAWRVRLDALLARLADAAPPTPPRVLVVGQWDPLYVMARGSLLDDLLRACGCVNVACDLPGDASGTFSEELVLQRRPDWILVPREPLPERLARRWAGVPAVARGRLADGAADDLVRGGPRILDALGRLAAVLRAEPKE
jgi:ABC-type Fe3+-hydroxamate transport system substrate-binding protein